MSQHLETIFQVGKGGISDEMCTQIANALEARELIKARVLENSGYTAKEAANELCSYLMEQMPIAPLCFKRGSVLTCWDGGSNLSPTRANVFLGSDLY